MPFGNSCEFKNFDACVTTIMGSGKTREAASAICGALQRDTKARCARKAIESTLKVDESLIDVVESGEELIAKVDVRLTTDLAKTVVVERRFNTEGEPLDRSES